MKKNYFTFLYTHLYQTLWYAGFKTVFGFGCTFKTERAALWKFLYLKMACGLWSIIGVISALSKQEVKPFKDWEEEDD